MIKIIFKNKEYLIEKYKIMFVLSRLCNGKISEKEIYKLMEKYRLFDELFLENANKL